MILRGISIGVFGALSDLSLSFEPGVNLVVGPNEAGKSTIFGAIVAALTVPARPTKRELDRALGLRFPIRGGDTLSVTLELAHEGEDYRLEKRWGADPAVRLALPTGGVVSDEEEARERIRRLLPASIATVESFFLARQSGLAATIEELRSRPGVLADLTDHLRKSILETGGVSIERFRRELEGEIADAFARWDRPRGGPEQGKGIANPWVKGAGRVVKAWYSRKVLERNLELVSRGEREVAERTEEIDSIDRELAGLERFLEANRGAAEAAAGAASLEDRSHRLTESRAVLRRDYDRWPELDRDRREMALLISSIDSELPGIRESISAAKAAESLRADRERLDRIAALKRSLEELRRGAEETTSVSTEALTELRKLVAERDRLAQAMRSGRITLSLRSAAGDEAILTASGAGELIVLAPGEEVTRRLDGSATVEHRGLTVSLRAGDEDPAGIARALSAANERLVAIYSSLGVGGLEEAAALHAAGSERSARIAALDARVAEELDGERLDELSARVGSAVEPTESLESGAARYARAEEQLASAKRRLGELDAAIAELATRYSSRDELFSAIAKNAVLLDEAESGLRALPALGEEYHTYGELLEAFETARRSVERRTAERHRLAIDRLEIQAGVPDESSEEIRRSLDEAERAFRRELGRAESIVRTLEATNSILEAPDEGLYAGIAARFASILSKATAGRYSAPIDRDGVPEAVVGADGSELDYPRLSAGTKDLYSLCLRLALVEYYSGEREGLCMMDDPLVDLDPVRQRDAARVVLEAAPRVQKVIFTCHPAHASLFPGANRIDLGS